MKDIENVIIVFDMNIVCVWCVVCGVWCVYVVCMNRVCGDVKN